MQNNYKKEIIWGLGIFIFIFFSINSLYIFSYEFLNKIQIPEMATVLEVKEDNRPGYQNSHPALTKAGIDGHLTVAFVGDIMLDRGVEYSVNKNFNGDYGQLFAKVSERLKSYDLLFGNLEGPVSDKGMDVGGIYSFRMDPVVLPVLASVGFDGFSLANNHILNYGLEALADTKIRLIENNFNIAGQKVIDLNGVRIMILPFNQFADLNLEQMKEEISLAKLANDLVIAFFHFGDEYQTLPNYYQKNIAQSAIDSGADLIVGAHPHVVQTLEQYKNVWIAYSLGNFIFDQYFSPDTKWGGLLEVDINTKDKRIEKVTLRKVTFNQYFQIESIE